MDRATNLQTTKAYHFLKLSAREARPSNINKYVLGCVGNSLVPVHLVQSIHARENKRQRGRTGYGVGIRKFH